MTALGLHALQHRGQEATGIVSMDADGFNAHRGIGHVGEKLDANAGHLDRLSTFAIGLTAIRQLASLSSTTSSPFLNLAGGFASHNGTTNAARLQVIADHTGSLMHQTTDTEASCILWRSHQQETSPRLIDALKQVEGAWSLVTLSSEGLIGARSPRDKAACAGAYRYTYVLSSETCGSISSVLNISAISIRERW